jgi:hypothetical protein
VYEKYPISGITESYRHVQGTKTVIMPLLITALFFGLVIFYFKGGPPVAMTAGIQPEAPLAASTLPSVPAATVPAATVPVPAPAGAETVSFDLSMPVGMSSLPLVAHKEVSEPDFTPWLSPLALDTYLRQKNRGFKQSIWDRGHWIEAIEGRWSEGRHEFRIAFDTIPDRERYQWYYRIDQTSEEYRDTLHRLRREGYTLVQSQAYERPDKSKRYQGVWQREIIKEKANPDSPGILGSAPGLRPLEVGSVHFQ